MEFPSGYDVVEICGPKHRLYRYQFNCGATAQTQTGTIFGFD